MVSLLREIFHYLHQPSTWGNQRGELINSTIKQISGAVAGDLSLQDRGVAHYLLSLLFSLVSLPFSFYFVSLIKNTKNTCYLSCVVKYVRSWNYAEVLDFYQRTGENMKKAWDRISEAHNANMPWLPIRIVLRNFYWPF